MSDPSATAIIVAYGVEAISLEWLPPTTPLIVVHNDSMLPDVEVANAVNLRGHGNVGFGAAVGRGLPLVTTPRVVLVNPDVRLTTEHWTALASGASYEVVAVPLTDADGAPTVVSARYPSALAAFAFGFELGRRAPLIRRMRRGRLERRQHDLSLADHWASAACVSYPTDALRSVGGFDPRFFLYFEDIDLCRRLARARPDLMLRMAKTPRAVHRVGGSAVTDVDRARVRAARRLSLQHYASTQRGLSWRLVSWTAAFNRPELDRTGEATVDAVVLSLGRRGAMGERRRVSTWEQLLRSCGARVKHIGLLDDHPSPLVSTLRGNLLPLARGHLQPEALSWAINSVDRRLAALAPDVVVCVSSRSFHPELMKRPVILDYVDRLSVSYRDRGRISKSVPARSAFRMLSVAADRFERRTAELPVARVAAGVRDAIALGATFLPVLVEVAPERVPLTDNHKTDLIFVGTLTYPPNVRAVERLAAWWLELQRIRPGTTFTLAGARPGPHLLSLAHRHGWTVVPDFEDAVATLRGATVAIVPIPFASGMQIKVVEAAAAGLPQVVTPPALQGLPPKAPVVVSDESRFLRDVAALLDDPRTRHSLSERGPAWVAENFTLAAVAPRLRELLAEMFGATLPAWQGGDIVSVDRADHWTPGHL